MKRIGGTGGVKRLATGVAVVLSTTLTAGALVGLAAPSAVGAETTATSHVVVDSDSEVGVTFENPSLVVVDSTGTFYASNGETIVRYVDGVPVPIFGYGAETAMPAPSGSAGVMAFDGADNLYIADNLTPQILKLAPDGAITVVVDGDTAGADFIGVLDMSVAADGTILYIEVPDGDTDLARIRSLAPNGAVTTMMTTAEADQMVPPQGPIENISYIDPTLTSVVVASDGRMYFGYGQFLFELFGPSNMVRIELPEIWSDQVWHLTAGLDGRIRSQVVSVPRASFPVLYDPKGRPSPSYGWNMAPASSDFSLRHQTSIAIRGDGTAMVAASTADSNGYSNIFQTSISMLGTDGSLVAASDVITTRLENFVPVEVAVSPNGRTFVVARVGDGKAVYELDDEDNLVPYFANFEGSELRASDDALYYVIDRGEGASATATVARLGYDFDSSSRAIANPTGENVSVEPGIDGSWYVTHGSDVYRYDTGPRELVASGYFVGPLGASDGSMYVGANFTSARIAPDGVVEELDGEGLYIDQFPNGDFLLVVPSSPSLVRQAVDGSREQMPLTSMFTYSVPGADQGRELLRQVMYRGVAESDSSILGIAQGETDPASLRLMRIVFETSDGGTSTTQPTTTTTTVAGPKPDACIRFVSAVDPVTPGDRYVARLYMAYFLRQPDVGGYDYWSKAVNDDPSIWLDLSYSFSTSDEFVQTYGRLSNSEFVELLYNNVLCREPDGGGFDYWLELLESGTITRFEAMAAVSEAQEFRVLTGTAS